MHELVNETSLHQNTSTKLDTLTIISGPFAELVARNVLLLLLAASSVIN